MHVIHIWQILCPRQAISDVCWFNLILFSRHKGFPNFWSIYSILQYLDTAVIRICLGFVKYFYFFNFVVSYVKVYRKGIYWKSPSPQTTNQYPK